MHTARMGRPGLDCTRYMMVDKLVWNESTGWPQIDTADGAPSDIPVPIPA
jgi:hypothetical protein